MRPGSPPLALAVLLSAGCSLTLELDGPDEVLLCSPIELCNGVDDDCDTLIDEATDRPCYAGPTGTEGVGPCQGGVQRCEAAPGSQIETYGPCVGQVLPEVEQCNAVDDDCDGVIDSTNGVPTAQACYPFDEGAPDVGRCRAGRAICLDGAFGLCQDATGPRPEADNEVDDDCDGAVDE